MLLLDTHALLWLVHGDAMDADSTEAIAAALDRDRLYVSAISAWEIGVAMRKRDNRPDLGLAPELWFRRAMRSVGAKLATITPAIAAEAASVPEIYGYGDPGDCFIIATARVRGLRIVTRDRAMRRLAAARPSYVSIVVC